MKIPRLEITHDGEGVVGLHANGERVATLQGADAESWAQLFALVPEMGELLGPLARRAREATQLYAALGQAIDAMQDASRKMESASQLHER